MFLPDYNVSNAERIIPACDLSEQISTAGTEASGTGNMKLALNGALTIGTLDGANVEMKDEVGDDNIFIFGMTAEEVVARRQAGYDPGAIYESNAELKRVLDMIATGYFSADETGRFQPLFEALTAHGDWFMLLADYASYVAAQERVDALYENPEDWTRRAILNVAGMGTFSSDRAIREYADRIWRRVASPPVLVPETSELVSVVRQPLVVVALERLGFGFLPQLRIERVGRGLQLLDLDGERVLPLHRLRLGTAGQQRGDRAVGRQRLRRQADRHLVFDVGPEIRCGIHPIDPSAADQEDAGILRFRADERRGQQPVVGAVQDRERDGVQGHGRSRAVGPRLPWSVSIFSQIGRGRARLQEAVRPHHSLPEAFAVAPGTPDRRRSLYFQPFAQDVTGSRPRRRSTRQQPCTRDGTT